MIAPRKCDICGETTLPIDEEAEMYDPQWKSGEVGNVICHAQCGLDKGMEVA